MTQEITLNPNEVNFARLDDALTPRVVHFDQPNNAPDFGALKLGQMHILELPEFRGMPLARVVGHVFEEYAEFYVPGLRFRDWLVEYNDSAPEGLRQDIARLADDAVRHHFFGSVVPVDNYWYVPYIRQGISTARWGGHEWTLFDRVVLIELAEPSKSKSWHNPGGLHRFLHKIGGIPPHFDCCYINRD